MIGPDRTSTGALTVAHHLAAALARHGVTHMFSQSLPSALMLAAEDCGIRLFAYREENAGAAMADGFARMSGRVGVVTAQNGPAAALLVAGLAEALKSSIPIVALVQDIDRAVTDRNAFQDLDHIALFQSCTKWTRRVSDPARVLDYIDMAFTHANSGRPGPVALLLPADLLKDTIDEPPGRGADLGRFPLDRLAADPARIAVAADRLARARQPLIVAGGGVHVSAAAEEVQALMESAHIPVLTTVMGKGAVDERHPLALGVLGHNMGRLAPGRHLRPIVDAADLVVFIGTRTAQNGTDSWTLFPRTTEFIHIDIDPVEIGRNYEALRLTGDARLTVAALRAELAGRRSRATALVAAIAEGRARHAQEIEPLLRAQASPIRPERLMADLRQVLTPETVVVSDASYSTLWTSCYLPSLKAGMRFLSPRGIAGIGWGFPMALGAKAAHPDRPVLCVVGDGGFAHVWAEIETAVRTQTAVVLTVLNNGVLGFQKDAEDTKFGRHTSACYFKPVDHAAIAAACGARSVRIEQPEDYLPAVRQALGDGGFTLIDVITDPGAYPPLTFFDGLDAVREARRPRAAVTHS